MSDNEYYSDTDSSSDNNSEDNFDNDIVDKKTLFKPTPNINIKYSDPYNSDSDEEEENFDDDEQDGGSTNDPTDNDEYMEEKQIEDLEDSESEEENIEQDDDENSENISSKKNKPNNKKQLMVIDEDEDEDEFNENYLEKFDTDIVKNYIDSFHPECLNHNYDEITKLSTVIRNADGIIIDPFHKTIPFLTKYEKARILGQRAKQIETGAKPFVKVPENVIDGYIIAELELKEKKIPFIIKRPIPGGACEYWNLKDLEVIGF
jgi:DNA-directed RNA polymerase I, II, and III subunit RPABC2